ncbi:DoxX family protein [Flavobacteriales bacterium]|jgi:hypothetical protein|nr:DoxX family protein [Flavobacteriales bacterium]
MDIDYAIIYFSALSFLFYGISSFYSRRLISEYERWGYNKLRIIIAILQILASFGLIIGAYYLPFLLSLVSFSLTIMMLVAVFARIKIKDSIANTIPAILYVIINSIIFYHSLF